MMDARTKAAVKIAVEAAVRNEFADAMDSVIIQEDRDADGDPVLRVLVIFKDKTVDAKKAAGLTRHLRPELAKRGEFFFPIVSFRSKADHRRLSEAA